MISSSTYALLRLAGWSYLPDLATRQLLQVVYRFTGAPPDRRSATFSRHYRCAFAVVVLGLLSYNLVEALRAMPPSFYDVLSVHPGVNETELRQAFKLFARKYHPDHGGSQDFFIQGQLALQTLKDPVKRFAYDRFGPDTVSWYQCTTIREYLRQGLLQSSGYHIVTGFGLVIWSSIQSSSITFWRYLLYLVALASELSLILNYPSTIWSVVLPQRVPHQHVLFLHQIFIFFSVALSKVAPVVFPTPVEEIWDPNQFRQMLEMTNHLTRAANKEVFGMLHTGLRSIHPSTAPTVDFFGTNVLERPSDQVMDLLTSEMENMMIENSLKQDKGPMRSAWNAAVTKGNLREKWRKKGVQAFLPPILAEDGESRLPSPSPSPPLERNSSPLRPQKVSRSSSYVRGRSLSC